MDRIVFALLVGVTLGIGTVKKSSDQRPFLIGQVAWVSTYTKSLIPSSSHTAYCLNSGNPCYRV